MITIVFFWTGVVVVPLILVVTANWIMRRLTTHTAYIALRLGEPGEDNVIGVFKTEKEMREARRQSDRAYREKQALEKSSKVDLREKQDTRKDA